MQLVEEPVEVEEGGRELVEDEGGAVEVDKGSLYSLTYISHTHYISSLPGAARSPGMINRSDR